MPFLDLSPRISAQSPVWPGDTVFHSEPHFTIGAELSVNVNAFHTTGHIGSHIDAPRHVINEADDITSIPIDSCIGPATVLHVDAESTTAPISLTEIQERLASLKVTRPKARLIVRRHKSVLTEWDEHLAGIDPDVIDWATTQGIKLIGTDLMSFDQHDSKHLPSHRAAIAGNIVMLEGLDLSQAPEGNHHLFALPLNIVGADASPVRAVLAVNEYN